MWKRIFGYVVVRSKSLKERPLCRRDGLLGIIPPILLDGPAASEK